MGLLDTELEQYLAQQPRMGLLNPRTQGLLAMGAGLLEAGAPRSTPGGLGGFGKAAVAGLGAYDNATRLEMGERANKLSSILNAMKIKREITQQEALANFGKGDTTVAGPTPGEMALTAGAAEGDIGPTNTNLKRIDAFEGAQRQRAPQIPNFQGLISAGVPGETVKALMEDWKLRNPELKFEGGMARNPRTGAIVEGVPAAPQTNQQGFSTTPRFNPVTGRIEIGITPGSEDAFTRQQEIGERTRARFDPVMSVTDAQGRPIPMTREGFANTFSGGQGGQGTTPGRGMGPTPAEKTALTTAAEGDAKRVLDLEAKIPNMLSVQRRLGRMEALTKDDQTYAAAGAELKNTLGSIVQAFGLNINQAKTANTEEYLAHVAELLKDRLASKDFGSGSGVSNLDIIAAQKPLPELVKTGPGRLQIIQALRADTERNLSDAQSARDYFDANKGLRGFRFPSELESDKRGREERVRNLGREGRQQRPDALPQGVTVRRIR